MWRNIYPLHLKNLFRTNSTETLTMHKPKHANIWILIHITEQFILKPVFPEHLLFSKKGNANELSTQWNTFCAMGNCTPFEVLGSCRAGLTDKHNLMISLTDTGALLLREYRLWKKLTAATASGTYVHWVGYILIYREWTSATINILEYTITVGNRPNHQMFFSTGKVWTIKSGKIKHSILRSRYFG